MLQYIVVGRLFNIVNIMEEYEMNFWHNQNTMTDSDIFEGNYRTTKKSFKIYKDNSQNFQEEAEETTSEKIYGSNGGLSDGSDSWKFGG